MSTRRVDGRCVITALMCAAAQGHVEIVTSLLERGADVNKVDKDEWTALIYAAK